MNLSDIELIEDLACAEASEDFWAYRVLINGGKLKDAWWQREASDALQQFYEDLINAERPVLIIEAPPQHGKSKMIVEFITWVAGKHPELRTIYTSFSERLGKRANMQCQRIYDTRLYKKIFPELRIKTIGMSVADAMGAQRNHEIIEHIGYEGCFRNTTVNGSITGEGLDLGVIDDPIKGREEAGSETVRDKTWDWFTDDFFTRFSDEAGLLAILTRWHVDDPIGRLKKHFGDKVKVLTFRAIATENEKHRKKGEALFPEHKSLSFLLERKAVMAAVNFEALYQQNPQIIGGHLIKGEYFKRYDKLPLLKRRIIYADTAQKTKERNDYSVFEVWGERRDGGVVLVDLLRGKWEGQELERRAKDFWAKHKAVDQTFYGQLQRMKVEDKSSGTGLIQKIRSEGKMPIDGIPRGTDKLTRLLDVLGYIESGYVWIPADAPWVSEFIDECEAFTADDSHMFDDQVDPMIDAINDMCAGTNAVKLWENQS